MDPIKLNLIICLTGTALWIFTFAIFFIWISQTKKRLAGKNINAEKSPKSYIASIIASACVIALPYLILFRPFITAVLEGCGILGTLAVMKDRLEKLKKQADESSAS